MTLSTQPGRFDFGKADSLSPEQRRLLNLIHTAVAARATGRLSASLQRDISVSLEAVELSTNRDGDGEGEPQAVSYELETAAGQTACIRVDSAFAGQMLELLLGNARSAESTSARAVTDLERLLLKRLVAGLLEDVTLAWTPHAPLSLKFRQQTDRRTTTPSPGPAVVRIRWKPEYDGRSGTIELILPAIVVWSLLADTVATAPRNSHQDALHRRLLRVPVRLRGWMSGTSVNLGELRSLQVGDIVMLDSLGDQPTLNVEINGKRFCKATVVSSGNRRGLKLLDFPSSP